MRVKHILIYLVENLPEGKIYVGKTNDIDNRLWAHKKKYGPQIKMTVIDQVNSKRRPDWEPIETMWIQTFISWGFQLDNKILGHRGNAYLNRFVL
jgi:hypothetical protein